MPSPRFATALGLTGVLAAALGLGAVVWVIGLPYIESPTVAAAVATLTVAFLIASLIVAIDTRE